MHILCLLKVSFLKQIVTLFYRQTMNSFRGHIRFTLTIQTVFLGEGKRRKDFAEWHVAWRAEWHNYAKYEIYGMT